MAFGTDYTGGNTRYLNIMDGKLVERVAEGTPGAVARTNKIGNVVHELKGDFVSGKLIGVVANRVRQTESYGEFRSTVLTIEDGPERFSVEVNQQSAYWSQLCQQVPSIDLNKHIRVRTYDFQGKDKDGKPKRVVGLAIYQRINENGPWTKENSSKLDWNWYGDKVGDLPPLDEVVFKGKKEIDDTKRVEYWVNMLENFSNELPDATKASETSAQPAQAQPATAQAPPVTGSFGDDDENLPF